MRGGVAGFKNIAYLCIAIQRNSSYKQNGSVVQLVRIHACHAWGRGFESRPDRQLKRSLVLSEAFFYYCINECPRVVSQENRNVK